jgi:hypothetical protein
VGYNNYRYFVNFLIWVTLGTVYISLICTPKLISSGLLSFPTPFFPSSSSSSIFSFTSSKVMQPLNIYVGMFRNVSSHQSTVRRTRVRRKLDPSVAPSSHTFLKIATETPSSSVLSLDSIAATEKRYATVRMGDYYPVNHISRVLTIVWRGSDRDALIRSVHGWASVWIRGCDHFLQVTHLKENLPDETLLLFFVAVICIGKELVIIEYPTIDMNAVHIVYDPKIYSCTKCSCKYLLYVYRYVCIYICIDDSIGIIICTKDDIITINWRFELALTSCKTYIAY